MIPKINDQERLIIFTRYPIPGTTKTRMIPALGAEGAAQLQGRLTEDTLAQGEKIKRHCSVRSGFPHPNLSLQVHFSGGNQQLMSQWLGEDLYYQPQMEGDLGAKMSSAFEGAFTDGMNRVIIIGIDCPNLDSELLNQAFNLLKINDIVLGPAVDGGYYLIGLSKYVSELFININWGTNSVLAQTQEIADKLDLLTAYLPVLPDLDYPEDLSLFPQYQNISKSNSN